MSARICRTFKPGSQKARRTAESDLIDKVRRQPDFRSTAELLSRAQDRSLFEDLMLRSGHDWEILITLAWVEDDPYGRVEYQELDLDYPDPDELQLFEEHIIFEAVSMTGVATVQSYWFPEETWEQVWDSLSVACEREGVPTAQIELSVVFDALADSYRAMIDSRRSPPTDPRRLRGRLRLLVNDEWAITTAGLESRVSHGCLQTPDEGADCPSGHRERLWQEAVYYAHRIIEAPDSGSRARSRPSREGMWEGIGLDSSFWTLDDLRAFLEAEGQTWEEQDIQGGVQFALPAGERIAYYHRRGKVVVRGVRTEFSAKVEAWRDGVDTGRSSQERQPDKPKVFVVYGHDRVARNELELELRRMELDPIILDQLSPSGDTLIEKLEKYLGPDSEVRLGPDNDIGFACVLLTPDDQGYRRDEPDQVNYRARQNVILELGMVLARLGRPRVAVLVKGDVEWPSDIGGLIYIPFKDEVSEGVSTLRKTLFDVGYQLPPG